jgi:hypothetical protein
MSNSFGALRMGPTLDGRAAPPLEVEIGEKSAAGSAANH